MLLQNSIELKHKFKNMLTLLTQQTCVFLKIQTEQNTICQHKQPNPQIMSLISPLSFTFSFLLHLDVYIWNPLPLRQQDGQCVLSVCYQLDWQRIRKQKCFNLHIFPWPNILRLRSKFFLWTKINLQQVFGWFSEFGANWILWLLKNISQKCGCEESPAESEYDKSCWAW